MWTTSLLMIARANYLALGHHNCSNHGVWTGSSPASAGEAKSLFHEMDVLVDVNHRRDFVFRELALVFEDLAVVGTRRAWALVFVEVFTVFFEFDDFLTLAAFFSSSALRAA